MLAKKVVFTPLAGQFSVQINIPKKTGVMFGSLDTTTGGNALKFYQVPERQPRGGERERPCH
ncbi:hypothetical protein F0M18_18135 [Pseudohalioglobus sediminis]|uniref:RecA family profile 2 domain-containing protein n=1 Tax=Pseudohalioglobus sediminis TaxID=2606449 RepID=A0A5B0WNR2_9GAMM|nr:hypothetical protein F0M18_18135 [Pseudohalioglobus sediminis]